MILLFLFNSFQFYLFFFVVVVFLSGKTEYVHARVTEPARRALEVRFLYSFCYAKGLLFSSSMTEKFMKDIVYPLI